MKKILNNGRVLVSFVSVFAILAVSLLSMFAGVTFVASAEGETDSEETTVTYPLNGAYDADFVNIDDGDGVYYTDVTDTYKDSNGVEQPKIVSNFTGFETGFVGYAKGRGTASDPYIVETANQFAAVVTGKITNPSNPSKLLKTENLCFKIADSVKAFNLSNTDAAVDFSQSMTSAQVEAALAGASVISGLEWTSSSAFMGRIDGNGAVVYGLKSSGESAGILPVVCGNVSVFNLTVKNSYFIGSNSSVFMGYCQRISGYAPTTVNLEMRNCSAYGNVVICNNNGASVEKAGITVGYNAFSANMIIEDCLVYDNIAKHATRKITYGLVGRLHGVNSATITNTITMDAVPHTLYYGSNAFHKSTFTNVYTNTLGQEWTNYDSELDANGNMIGNGLRYVYKYLPAGSTGIVKASFNHYNRSGTNLTYDGKGYTRDITGPMYNVEPSELIGSASISGISSDKWTYNAGAYPTPKIYHMREYSAGVAWSGEMAVKFFAGEGTQELPYVVNTAEEFVLMLMSENDSKYYKLGADIVINDSSVPGWTDNAKKWFTSNDIPAFKGNLEGDGHTVSGIYFDGSQAGENVGLIPVIASPGTVRNIKIANSSITATKGAAGALAGAVDERCRKVIKFDAVSIDNSIEFAGGATNGGIVGKIGYSMAYFNDCISETAGIFGSLTGFVKVKRCISVNSYPFGTTANVSAENVYTDVDGDRLEITDDEGNVTYGVTVLGINDMQGSAASANMPGLNFPTSWKVATNDLPTPTGVAASSEGVRGGVWSGAIASKFAGGTGTPRDPYLIETPEQLALCVQGNRPETSYCYKLTADIYLNDIESPLWAEKIGCNEWYNQRTTVNYNNFRNVTFDGDGHVVYGLFVDHEKDSSYVYAGLFPTIGIGTTIKNVGVSQAQLLMNRDNMEEHAACIVGYVISWNSGLYYMDPNDADANAIVRSDPGFQASQPKVINCFADHTCYVSCERAGGLISGVGGPVLLENCAFTGAIDGNTDPYYWGTLLANDWSYGSTIRDCISLPQCGSKICGGSSASDWRISPNDLVTTFENVYYFANKVQGGTGGNAIKIVKPTQRVGEAAKEAMPNLDWVDEYNYDPNDPESDETTWLVVEEGTPIPAIFSKGRTREEYEKFSDKQFEPPLTTVSFMTDTDEVVVDDIQGRMYSKMTLPIITRPGYIFTGWYVFSDYTVEYPYDYFPPRNLTLYAGWEQNGVVQNFENYPDSYWDYDDTQWLLNKPGAKGGYKNAYVRNGSKSMHLLDTNTEPVDVLLNYEDMLEPGQAYTMTFWVATDKANNPSTLLTLVHNEKPVYLDTQVAAENMAVVTGLKVGEWVQYSYSFTAQTKWISLRATGNSSLYFDDIVIGKIDGTLNGGNLIGTGTGGAGSGTLSPNTSDAVSVAALISALMAGAVIVVISRKNTVEVID